MLILRRKYKRFEIHSIPFHSEAFNCQKLTIFVDFIQLIIYEAFSFGIIYLANFGIFRNFTYLSSILQCGWSWLKHEFVRVSLVTNFRAFLKLSCSALAESAADGYATHSQCKIFLSNLVRLTFKFGEMSFILRMR